MDNVTIEQITKKFNIEFNTDTVIYYAGTYLNNVSSLQHANEHSLTWINPSLPNKAELAEQSNAGVIVADKDYGSDHLYLITENPKEMFSKIANYFFPPKDAEIILRSNVKIGSNTVIGGEGFGYSNENKIKFPHYGNVVIENDVEIGNNTCIDRGSLLDTIIRANTKIDNLVHIAHNVEIGENCLIVAGSVIGGSVLIGNNCFIGMGANIKNGITIGDNSIIGMGAVVLKDVPANEVWVGNPAKKIKKLEGAQK